MPDQSNPYRQPWEVPNENPAPPVETISQQPSNPADQKTQPDHKNGALKMILGFGLTLWVTIGAAFFIGSLLFVWWIIQDSSKPDSGVQTYTAPMAFLMTMLFVGPLIAGGLTGVFILSIFVRKSSKPNKVFLTVTGVFLLFLLLILAKLLIT